MQDSLGREIHIGELVRITTESNLIFKSSWIVEEFLDFNIGIDVVLKNFYNGQVRFVSIMEIEKQI